MTAFSDENLMHRVASGEVQHLGLLFERYHRRLFGYFLKLTQKNDAAEDLVQEVFFRILKYRNTYKPNVPFRMWLFRIAANLGKDHFGKNKDEAPIEENLVEADASDPVADLAREVDLGTLKRAFDTLSPEKREVLILSRFENMKYKEIAEVTGATVAAVKVRVHRAIKDLRDGFNRLEKEMAS